MNMSLALQWRHNEQDSVSNQQPHDCLLNRLFRRRSKKTSKLRVTGLCAGNSPGTGEFPAQMASYAENVFIWWRHHGHKLCKQHELEKADLPVAGTGLAKCRCNCGSIYLIRRTILILTCTLTHSYVWFKTLSFYTRIRILKSYSGRHCFIT